MSSIALIRPWICSRSIGVMKVLCSSRFTSAVMLVGLALGVADLVSVLVAQLRVGVVLDQPDEGARASAM